MSQALILLFQTSSVVLFRIKGEGRKPLLSNGPYPYDTDAQEQKDRTVECMYGYGFGSKIHTDL